MRQKHSSGPNPRVRKHSGCSEVATVSPSQYCTVQSQSLSAKTVKSSSECGAPRRLKQGLLRLAYEPVPHFVNICCVISARPGSGVQSVSRVSRTDGPDMWPVRSLRNKGEGEVTFFRAMESGSLSLSDPVQLSNPERRIAHPGRVINCNLIQNLSELSAKPCCQRDEHLTLLL